jgi:NAD(P)-dependent dehydrogenase (short-subunit alcohol dehydrogenase family)
LTPEQRSLAGKSALVTGGGRGIGRAVALALGEAGAEVAVSARTEEELRETVRILEERGVRAHYEWGDLLEPQTPTAMVKAAEALFGRVDILVNNAGVAPTAKFADITLEEWERVLRLNLTAAFLASQAALPGMLERGWGRIVNVASTAGKVGYPYTAAYTASKHGLLGLTRALAAELARTGVTVNAVCPGYVDTALTEESARRISQKTGRSMEESRQALAAQNPAGRLISPEEVGRAVLFLACEEASGINGEAVNVDAEA